MSTSFFDNVVGNIRTLVHETSIEVFAGAIALCSIFSTVAYNKQDAKKGKIQLAFSEIGDTKRYLKRQGLETPPLTLQYSITNEVVMKVFEANNEAYARSGSNETFARELEVKVEPTLRIHHQIGEYAAELPPVTAKARKSLEKLYDAQVELAPVIEAFAAAWDDDHTDVTHTEYTYTTSCDSDGKNCTTTAHPYEVYDYTIHTYDYDAESGARAAQLLADFMQRHPDLHIEEALIPARKTEADNEYAIWKTAREILGHELSPEEYLAYANSWATGSNFTKYTPLIEHGHDALEKLTPKWNGAAKTAHSDRYRTYSRSDDGPVEFRIAEAALNYAVTISQQSGKITDGVEHAARSVPLINQKVAEYIAVTLDRKPGDADALRKEIMGIARETYRMNFEDGLDVQPFKWEMVVLWGVVGLFAGAAAGKGVDYLIDKHGGGPSRRGRYGM